MRRHCASQKSGTAVFNLLNRFLGGQLRGFWDRVIEYAMRKATASFLLAAFASVLSLTLPLYRGQTRVQHFGKPSELQVRHETLPGVNGPLIYYRLAIPVIVAGLPLLLRFRAARIICAALLTVWVVLGAASIGIFYLPSAIAMVLAASEKPT